MIKLSHLIPAMLLQLAVLSATAQNQEKDIMKNRQGDLIVNAKPGATVIVEQLRHEFWFGCAISNGFVDGTMPAADRAQYNEKFLQNFNSAVTENAVKWLSMEREKGKVNYAVVDSILAWTDRNHIPLRGHNLYWGIDKFVQPWLKEMSNEELRATLQRRAETVTSRYRGRFAEYDLNNEMVHGNFYEDRLGPGITKDMATWAHNGDPGAKLFLNDYDITTGNKLPEYMAQIRSLLKQGVPVAGIGVQGHLHAETFDRKELKRSLDSLAIFKLPIRITEFNVPGQRSRYYKEKILTMTPEAEAEKAKELTDFYRICFAHPAVGGIIMWGFWEGANWIPVSSLYHKDWSPTPAAEAYQKLLFKEWWTKETGKVGKDGKYQVKAFYGKYRVTVNGISQEVELKKADGKVQVKV
ncbi:MAG TPA: endo-1,4-beta-xylanase [Chryseolinea sp.]|nr:endo-1,4-beta-xylanase [Chryseolinea sp.]